MFFSGSIKWNQQYLTSLSLTFINFINLKCFSTLPLFNMKFSHCISQTHTGNSLSGRASIIKKMIKQTAISPLSLLVCPNIPRTDKGLYFLSLGYVSLGYNLLICQKIHGEGYNYEQISMILFLALLTKNWKTWAAFIENLQLIFYSGMKTTRLF